MAVTPSQSPLLGVRVGIVNLEACLIYFLLLYGFLGKCFVFFLR